MTLLPSRRITNAVRLRGCLSLLAFVPALLLASLPPAQATLVNGENAVDILGEFNSPSSDTTADYVKGCINNGASSLGFNQSSVTATTGTNPGGILDATNHRLFVA